MYNYEKIQPLLLQEKLDAILVSDPFNIHYLSGYTGGTGYLYISGNKKVLLTDFRYIIQGEKESPDFKIIKVEKGEYIKSINELLKKDNVYNLGFEDKSVTYEEFLKLDKDKVAKNLSPLGESLNNLRCVKTKEEIEYISKSESILDKTFERILSIIKPGMTELEVAAELDYIIKKNGATKLSFDSIVASGINSSMPHATPSHKMIEYGDFLTLDFGCIYKGYCSDMTRTIVIGKATDEQKKIYNTVLEAQTRVLDQLCAGLKGSEVDKIARDFINNQGYEGYFGHGLGHSLGLYIHENPRLSQVDDTILLTNMLETVEPGIYIPNFGGVRIEDLVVIKEGGIENLTRSEKRLIEL